MSLFSYPVEITTAELKNESGIDIEHELNGKNVKAFFNTVYSSVYDGCIYATGDKSVKDRIIETYKTLTENAIKRALILQAEYIFEIGSIGTESGITIGTDGQKSVISKDELRSKTICISAIDALKACPIPLLYAGE